MRPLIGVTRPTKGGWTQNLAIRLAILIAGGRSINISPARSRFKTKIDGLIISGGTDIFPGLFESPDIKEKYKYDHERDELEYFWISMAKKRNLPLFCICRGTQLLNVYEGGTLFTNIKNIYESANYPSSLLAKVFFRKGILIEKKSHLYDAFQKEESVVNSMHSQSIDRPGESLETTSMEPIGVIQSVENPKKPYIVGVQFHPEFLIYRADIRRLFKQFVDACKKGTTQHL